jgi:predicted GNAT superfamily acetyltransferase
MAITIRSIHDVTDCYHFQELERLVWGSEPTDIVPVHVLITAIHNGGMILGAYDDEGPFSTGGMVGATFWWLGIGADPAQPPGSPPRLKACSHMLGIVPEWQGRGIGLRLKLAQRQAVLEQGLTDWITWTYDPLFRVNGVFNIHRLGATCSTYLHNLYGVLSDGLNAGVPSDRCQVDWRLNSPHVLHDISTRRQAQPWDLSAAHILPVQAGYGFPRPIEQPLELDGRPLAVPIPEDILRIRRADGELSMAWRLYMRHILERAFAAGYTMVDCIHTPETGWRYILVREYL